MNSKIQFIIIPLIALLPMKLYGQESFKAEMTNVKQGTKEIYQVQSNGDKYRYDFEDGRRKRNSDCMTLQKAKQPFYSLPKNLFIILKHHR